MSTHGLRNLAVAAIVPALLVACADTALQSGSVQLAAAQPGVLQSCTDLAARLSWPKTVITAADWAPAGKVMVAGQPVAEHCLVTGRMNERVSAVDGQTYVDR